MPRNEKRDISTDFSVIKKMRQYYEQLSANKSENLTKIDKFLEIQFTNWHNKKYKT